MKIARQLILSAALALIVWPATAAPVESVESSRASVALQKVDAFLSEQVVVDQLKSLGVSSEDARARLAKLNEAQLEQLAAQVDLLQAGGKIRGAHLHPLGPLGCFLHQIHYFLHYVIRSVFCWEDVP
jgi:hypothetical protein